MIKKIISILSLACLAIVSLASTCFASPVFDYENSGVIHAYNGSYWYDQGYVYVYGDPDYDYYIWVGLSYDNYTTGWKRSTLCAGHESTCTSNKIQDSDGTVCYYADLKH